MKNRKNLPLVKVTFPLGLDQWHGFETESVWAEKIANNRYRIRNTPFCAKGVSFEDIVFVKKIDESLFFESISIAAGHSTYRILLEKAVPDKVFLKYWAPLELLGCTYESADYGKRHLLAVDVPSDTNIHRVYDLLDQAEKDGIWDFEEAHCAHSL